MRRWFRKPVVPPTTLEALRAATERVERAEKDRTALICEALLEGASERAVGAAAGVSGPAINQLKRRIGFHDAAQETEVGG